MKQSLGKRAKIRLFTYAAACVAVLAGFAIQGYGQSQWYRAHLEYTYQRAYTDLDDCITSISDTLEKSIYVNTPTQQSGLAARLMRESSMAKASLAVFPVEDASLEVIQKFISQTGDFAMTLSNQIARGQELTQEDYDILQQLGTYAQKLKGHLSEADSILSVESFSTVFPENLEAMAEDFTDYPSLIYDGPFSDHIAQRQPAALEGAQEVPQGNAQNNAAEFLGISRDLLTHSGDTEGNLPTRNFTGENLWVSVTRQGGIVSSFFIQRSVGEETINAQKAIEIADAFFASRGMEGMEESYYVTDNGACTINYAYSQDGILYYPDLIKITVALDTGEILKYDADGYLMNHAQRSPQTPALTEAQARASISPLLTISGKGRLTVIPSASLSETLTWEFHCTAEDDTELLVYINAESGMEEEILILTRSDNGILVR